MKVQGTDASAMIREIQKARIEDNFRLNSRLQSLGQKAEDQLNVSTDAKKMHALTEHLNGVADRMPDVRDDRIADVRKKLDTGFYKDEQFTGQLADRMMNDPELRQVLDMHAGNLPSTDYREDLMNDVAGKIQDSFYSDSQVMDFVAERLISIYAGHLPETETGY